MIRGKEFQKFELKLLRSEKMSIEQKYKILDALYEEAKALHVFPLKDPLAGLDIDIKVAKVLNHVSKAA